MVPHLALGVAVLIGGVGLFLIGFAVHAILQEYRKDRVPAVLYHHFVSKQKIDEGEVSNCDPVYFCYDTAFDEQLNYLHQEGYTTISLNEFLAFQDGQKTLPAKPIILTFDDGFMSNYLYAFPILKKYGMKATIFATVEQDSRNFKKYAAVDVPLTRDQMIEMSEYGISIESHSMTHRYLSDLEPEVVRWELEESRRLLENLLRRPVRFIAIPSGAYSRAVKRAVKEAGYYAAFCMSKGTNNRKSDRHALRRLVIGRDFSLEDFRRVLEPATACYLRFTSSLQTALLFLLGPSGLDAFRKVLYGSRLGTSVIRGQLWHLVPGLVVAVLLMLALGVVVVWQENF